MENRSFKMASLESDNKNLLSTVDRLKERIASLENELMDKKAGSRNNCFRLNIIHTKEILLKILQLTRSRRRGI